MLKYSIDPNIRDKKSYFNWSTDIIPSQINTITNKRIIKPRLINKSDLLENLNNLNIVGYDSQIVISSNIHKTYSPKLLNYVEPYIINNKTKTLFYTEVNTDLTIGDKVFIINGTYDSNELIKIDKYKKGRDGYKILFIDKCKIVLDIDYNSVLPNIIPTSITNVYTINTYEEFVHANREITTKNGVIENKYSLNTNNIIFISNDIQYTDNNIWDNCNNINITRGFYIKNDMDWIDITTDFESGLLNTLLIYGDFEYNMKSYKNNFYYKYEGEWINDVLTIPAYISKSNFRSGVFNGEWNGGIFGQYDTQIEWVNAIWTNGTLLNSKWLGGSLNSINTATSSYYSYLDSGKVYQKQNTLNNANRGYNFIVDSTILNSNIVNGSFYNNTFGQYTTFSNIENYLIGGTSSFDVIAKGYFNKCNFINSYINNSELKKICTNNSKIEYCKSINSYYNNSFMNNSIYNSDDIIKILNYSVHANNNDTLYIYKFYISEDSYNRLKRNDVFYIKGLLLNGNKELLNFFDKKFKISAYTEYIENNFQITGSKNPFEFSVMLSTPDDNMYKYDSISEENPNNLHSIDIWVKRDSVNGNANIEMYTNINITDAYVIDSDYNSGLMLNTDWNSGSHIECNNDNNITIPTLNGGVYNMIIENNKIIATCSYDYRYSEMELSNIGDIVYLESVDYNGLRLPDTYKVINNSDNRFVLEPIGTQSLTNYTGIFKTNNAFNRYGYIKKLKIDKTNIKSGFFKRSYIVNSIIQNNGYDSYDKDFNDMQKIRSLVISDSIFSNNSNILSNAIYTNSFILSGSDLWNGGILYNSLWNGGTFSNGIVRESSWVNGIFNSGEFYNNKTFNGVSTVNNPYYYSNNIKSYYIEGTASDNNYNNRYSWRDGIFNSGDFYKSDWENGTFSSNFNHSKFYNGYINNATIGNINTSVSDTHIYNAIIENSKVDNATIYSIDTSYDKLTQQTIIWNSGVFNNGVFGCDITQNINNSAIWNNGTFNGGQFITNGKWKNGDFNGGDFISSYGWTISSTYSIDYGWENGKFNNGTFGNGNGLTNSTWFTGEFNGGVFKGRIWNDGIFTMGEFQGSGDSPVDGLTCSKASDFVDSYTYSYYGKWNNGIFTSIKDKFILDEKTYTMPIKSNISERIQEQKKAIIKNALWLGGTFDHTNGEMKNSVWLDGSFKNGYFNSSVFNPFVKRNGSTYSSFNTNDTCIWQNGILNDSDFYISKWENGRFIMGTACGMIWQNGISDYMNAFNIFWEKGTWRNGNWYGSPFEYNNEITDNFNKAIIDRGFEWNGTQSAHIWNIFQQPMISATASVVYATASTISGLSGKVIFGI